MSLQSWAAWYARQGLEIFPVHVAVSGSCSCGVPGCNSPGKHPATKHGVKDATSDMAQIVKWWVENPSYNIGLHCNQFTVLDVDGEIGKESLRKFVKQNKDLTSFMNGPRAKTGGGGYHFFFKASDIGNKVGIAPGLDLRGAGGYVIAAPSLHHSGKRYEWDIGLNEGLIPDGPGWVRYLVKKQSGQFKSIQTRSNGEKPKIDIDALPSIANGTRHNELTRLAGRLFWEGRGFSEVAELLNKINFSKCSPPLGQRDIDRIVRGIARKEGLVG